MTNSVLSFCERNFTVFAFLETVQLFSLTLRLFLNFHEDKIFSFFGFWLALFVISCNRDEIEFDAPGKKLRFSVDTLVLDTVYNQVRSETYAVKIYNDENKDISIPKIYLESGNSSLYRINVDGKAGTEFTNVPLRKKDSLYIFVEIAPIANAPEAIAEEKFR